MVKQNYKNQQCLRGEEYSASLYNRNYISKKCRAGFGKNHIETDEKNKERLLSACTIAW